MESQSQSSKGDSSKSPMPHDGQGDEPSKGDCSKSPMPQDGKGDEPSKGDCSKSPMPQGVKGDEPIKKPPTPQMLPITRPPKPGTRGRRITLLTNHFKVSGKPKHDYFYHYHVDIKYGDGHPAAGERVGRKVMRQLHETYASQLAGKQFAYDGETGLYTAGPLPFTTNVFDVALVDASPRRIAATSGSPGGDASPGPSDTKRMKKEVDTKIFKVEITFAAKIPMNMYSQDALRVLDIILRQHSAKQNCLLVRQSFFRKDSRYVELGGGVRGCQGFYSSFRPTQSGLSLNVDLTTTMVVRPGPVIDFLLFNQDVKDTSRIDWRKAKQALKKLRIETIHTKAEFTITGLTENNCNEQTFPLKQKDGSFVDITVYDYYMDRWSMKLEKSANFPCLIVGKSTRPTYLPLEVCLLVPLQRYKRSLSTLQRSKLVEGSRQRPDQRMLSVSGVCYSDTLNSARYCVPITTIPIQC